MSLKDRVNEIVDSEVGKDRVAYKEKIFEMAQQLCKKIIYDAEENIKKGNYQIIKEKQGKTVGVLDYKIDKVVSFVIFYEKLPDNSSKLTHYNICPDYTGYNFFYKYDYEFDFFVYKISSILEEEGFKITVHPTGWYRSYINCEFRF